MIDLRLNPKKFEITIFFFFFLKRKKKMEEKETTINLEIQDQRIVFRDILEKDLPRLKNLHVTKDEKKKNIYFS